MSFQHVSMNKVSAAHNAWRIAEDAAEEAEAAVRELGDYERSDKRWRNEPLFRVLGMMSVGGAQPMPKNLFDSISALLQENLNNDAVATIRDSALRLRQRANEAKSAYLKTTLDAISGP